MYVEDLTKDLISDVERYEIFLKKIMTGWVKYIVQSFNKANKKHMVVMVKLNRVNVSYMKILTIYMDGQFQNIFFLVV